MVKTSLFNETLHIKHWTKLDIFFRGNSNCLTWKCLSPPSPNRALRFDHSSWAKTWDQRNSLGSRQANCTYVVAKFDVAGLPVAFEDCNIRSYFSETPMAAGAHFGRPVSVFIPMRSNAAFMVARSTYFVSTSAGFSVPRTLCKKIRFE